jgi:murein DD-endopeptidase MepM/ murein hydrolase activator NlpD
VPTIYRTLPISLPLGLLLAGQALFAGSHAAIGSPENLKIDPVSPRQGQTMVLHLTLPADATPPVVQFQKKTYKFHAQGTKAGDMMKYRALVAVPVVLPAGNYSLGVGEETRNITVTNAGFPVQKIHLSKDKDNFISSPGEEEAVQKARECDSEKQLWDGTFRVPCKARITTRFGLRRMVNGRLLADYFHTGIDYGGGLGAPVYATQGGRVILAHNGWRLHGNIVALDHGQGVVSFYLHLSKILVKPGELVAPGQMIGKVGSTGRATGPHLHFSLYVNGEATDPSDWFIRHV